VNNSTSGEDYVPSNDIRSFYTASVSSADYPSSSDDVALSNAIDCARNVRDNVTSMEVHPGNSVNPVRARVLIPG
jgi:hypothetical protein